MIKKWVTLVLKLRRYGIYFTSKFSLVVVAGVLSIIKNLKMTQKIILFILLILPTLSNAQNINKVDVNGKKQGLWEKQDPKGRIMYRGTFKDNYPIGEMKRFHKNGTLKAILLFSNKGKKAKASLYNESAILKAKGNFIDSKKDSTWNYFDTKGNMRMTENYQLGLKNGECIYRFKDGTVSEQINYKNNKKEGFWIRYFKNGEPYIEATYSKGILHGNFQIHYLNGIIEYGGKYVNNKKEGEWKHFSKKGELLFTIKYKNGIASNQDELDKYQQDKLRNMEAQKDKLMSQDPEKFVNDPDSFLRTKMGR